MITSLFHLFLLLGSEWVLWVLIAATFLALVVFFDRWRQLRSQERVGSQLWSEKVSGWVENGAPADWNKTAAEFAVQYPCVESRMLLGLSKRNSLSSEGLDRALHSILAAERIQLEKYLAVLGTLGNAAPFIGLFGTVLGIIKAFSELDRATGNSGLTAISGGLAEALVTTATGLVLAIPCAMSFNFFQRKIKTIFARSNTLAGLIIGEHK